MRGMKLWVGALGLLVLGAVSAQAAVTWQVIDAADCTALGVPSFCCKASTVGECPVKTIFGNKVVASFTLTAAAGTATANGDTVGASEVAKLGFNNIESVTCGQGVIGTSTILLQPKPVKLANASFKVQLFTVNGVDAGAAVLVGTSSMDCFAVGY